ncbi:hypothetical protein QPR87_09090 [Paracoccus sp. SSJ]|nr:hypothetical protein [Paracoccus sp. SSJ]
MALKLVLWFGDAMIDADTMLRYFVCSWYQRFTSYCFINKKYDKFEVFSAWYRK